MMASHQLRGEEEDTDLDAQLPGPEEEEVHCPCSDLSHYPVLEAGVNFLEMALPLP